MLSESNDKTRFTTCAVSATAGPGTTVGRWLLFSYHITIREPNEVHLVDRLPYVQYSLWCV